MEKLELLHEGKSKQLYSSNDENKIIIHYKDDTTAFNGIKKAKIASKGILNNEISSIIFTKLNELGLPTHFLKKLNDRDCLCKKATIIPLEVVVRNVVAGSMSKRLNIEEGTIPPNTIKEIDYKSDTLGNPLINDDHAVALGICSYDDLKEIYSITDKVNSKLKRMFDSVGIILVDFKLEFGRDEEGHIILTDEISPDTCRLWDKESLKKLDKDRFRRDLGKVLEAYEEILKRLKTL
ncbi:MAG: phosphoribosylaminoimidazolesuccinocarboxamide synthase [Acholeplasmatales bacterium]|nr:phosphoribosylaminoimidazolesuccinocarboxamide synthase [Acholeplasmatales bacterium]